MSVRDATRKLVDEMMAMSSKTMGERADHLDDGATAILRDIPGLSNIVVTVHSSMMAVGLIGWSPTLHRLDLFERSGRNHTNDLPGMARWFQGVAHCLELRARDASRLGIRKPLDPAESRVDHLFVDASLAAMTRARGVDVAARAGLMVQAAHMGCLTGHSFDGRLQGDDARLAEHHAPSLREVGWKTRLGADDESPVYDGWQLTFRGDPIPETMLAALGGRRVDTLISTGTPLDERMIQTVLSVEVDGVMHYAVRPVPDLVPLQDVVSCRTG